MRGLLLDTSTQARRQIGHTIARLLYRLQTPDWDSSYVTQYGHKIWINKTTKQAVILYDETEQIPLRTHKQDGTYWGRASHHVLAWLNTRFPNATDEQKAWIRNWIKNNETATVTQLLLENGGTPVNLPGLPAWASIVDPVTLDLPIYDDNGDLVSGDENWQESGRWRR